MARTLDSFSPRTQILLMDYLLGGHILRAIGRLKDDGYTSAEAYDLMAKILDEEGLRRLE